MYQAEIACVLGGCSVFLHRIRRDMIILPEKDSRCRIEVLAMRCVGVVGAQL